MTVSKQKEYYIKKNSKIRLTTRKINIIRLISEFMSKYKTVLDVGCGDGFLSMIMERQCKSLMACDIAIPETGKMYLEVDISKQTINNKFDIVTCFDVLEHLENLDPGIKNIKSMIKDHGILIINHPIGVDKKQPIDHFIYYLDLIKKINLPLIFLKKHTPCNDDSYYFMVFENENM